MIHTQSKIDSAEHFITLTGKVMKPISAKADIGQYARRRGSFIILQSELSVETSKRSYLPFAEQFKEADRT